jgi:hypothetical protein
VGIVRSQINATTWQRLRDAIAESGAFQGPTVYGEAGGGTPFAHGSELTYYGARGVTVDLFLFSAKREAPLAVWCGMWKRFPTRHDEHKLFPSSLSVPRRFRPARLFDSWFWVPYPYRRWVAQNYGASALNTTRSRFYGWEYMDARSIAKAPYVASDSVDQ